MILRVAVIDDWLGVAEQSTDWAALNGIAEITVFSAPLGSTDAAAEGLKSFDIILPMRERQSFGRTLLERLPDLKMLALTGFHAPHVDLEYCRERGITVCGSGRYSPAATAELTLGLILASSRAIPAADQSIRAGRFQAGLPLGQVLEGRRLGIVGLGKIGTRVAHFGRALGMDVVAWSPNLTVLRGTECGAARVEKEELFQTSDVVSIHLIYAASTHHIVGAEEIKAMQPGALLVNTARAALVDGDALRRALSAGHIRAALDVFEVEPTSANDPIIVAPNTVLTPHLGFSAAPGFPLFYSQSIENIVAFASGAPIRLFPAP